ncbi:MAG: hypothetical protein ACK46N_09665, partial [Dolichospermum sp.]
TAHGSKLRLTTANAIENVIGGAGGERSIGICLDNRFVGGAGPEIVTGGVCAVGHPGGYG